MSRMSIAEKARMMAGDTARESEDAQEIGAESESIGAEGLEGVSLEERVSEVGKEVSQSGQMSDGAEEATQSGRVSDGAEKATQSGQMSDSTEEITQSGRTSDGAEKANQSEQASQDEQSGQEELSAAEKRDRELEQEFEQSGGIVLNIQVTAKDLYRFLLYHSYGSFSGLLGVVFSLFCLGYGIYGLTQGADPQMMMFMLFIGLWFTVLSPLVLRYRAAMQVKRSPSLQKPLTYIFIEKGILQRQGDQKAACKWNQVTRVVYMKKIWVLYFGRVRGNILPVSQLGEREAELRELINRNTHSRIHKDLSKK